MSNLKKQMENCILCPRQCRVNRWENKTGICGQSSDLKVARADLHMWEEPCISGTKGSGAVFFAGCSLHCVFCQNHNIATGNAGKIITIQRLAEIFLELQEKEANNINLVTAAHFVPQIVETLELARQQGLHLPIVYNSSGYEEVETLRQLEGYVDIYLPDLKYVDTALSQKYSFASNYFEKASAAIAEMVRQVGTMEFTEEGIWDEDKAVGIEEYQRRSELGENLLMKRGVIVRHLLLPGAIEDSKRVLRYLLKEYGEKIFISIMNQYTPLPQVLSYPELNRRITETEYENVIDYAVELGIENGFIQEGDTAKESFIPEFDGKGV